MEIKVDIKDRDIFFSGKVDEATMKDLSQQIVGINNADRITEKIADAQGLVYKPKPIKIYIDSPGGFVYNCFGALGHIENSVTPVHTIATGAAMSCGFIILIHGHKRFAFNKSTILYHQIATGAQGKIADMEQKVKEGKRLQKQVEKSVLEKTKITKKKLKENKDKKTDWFMSPKEALRLGVIDKIV